MNELCYNIPIEEESDVGLLREATSSLAKELGFDTISVGEITLAASEIGQNAFRHGGGGVAEIHSLKNGKVIQIIIRDKGNGIENIDLAMREGFSTIRTSLGIGLEAAQRLVDKFDIQSTIGEGTCIRMEKYLPMTTDRIEYGVVSVPDEQYNFNGDEYIVKEFDGDKVLLAVIDGIGQGYDAYAMSMLIKKFIEKNFALPLEVLIDSCDFLLKESELTGGAAMSLAILEAHQVTYLGIGDTHSYLYNGQKKELPNFEGRVGDYQLPLINAKQFPIEGNTCLVMCTDGISTKVSETDIPLNESAQKIANFVFNHFHKAYGDVTVLSTKLKSLS